jgi:hypothetical protein
MFMWQLQCCRIMRKHVAVSQLENISYSVHHRPVAATGAITVPAGVFLFQPLVKTDGLPWKKVPGFVSLCRHSALANFVRTLKLLSNS